jgi:hypothetical protein
MVLIVNTDDEFKIATRMSHDLLLVDDSVFYPHLLYWIRNKKRMHRFIKNDLNK